jgi:hypothetical protein
MTQALSSTVRRASRLKCRDGFETALSAAGTAAALKKKKGRFFTVYFCMRTVKHLLCPMNYLRNRINFVFFALTCLANLEGSVGLILAKASAMRISIPLDLSSRSFVPLPCFIRSRRPIPLLAPSLVLFVPSSASGTCWVSTLELYRLLYSS